MKIHQLIAIIALVVSVLVSGEHAAGYWVVGPVFGVAFLLANHRAWGRLDWKHLAFLIDSTLTYALVWWIADHGWSLESDLLDSLVGPLSIAVVIGSISMPFVHSFLFKVNPKHAYRTSVMLIVSWYAVMALANVESVLAFEWDVDYTFVSIALWQGIYFWRNLCATSK